MRLVILIFISYAINSYSQADQWISFPIEVNDRVSCLAVYQDKLIAGGFFTKAGNQIVNRIAAWDGSSWSNLGAGIKGGYNPYVIDVIEFNNELYVIGNFDSAGDVASKDIAKWDGTQWKGMGIGSNLFIFAIAIYKNEIYVGGAFDSIGGIASKYIAKWDGQTWQRVGEEFYGNNVNVLYEYKNELYALGPFDSIGGVFVNNIARWNGIKWNKVSNGINSYNSALIEWRGNLICGSQQKVIGMDLFLDVHKWDGNSWSLFNRQSIFPIRKFLIYHDRLYCAGGSSYVPNTYSLVARWDSISSSWKNIGAGIDNTTYGLCAYKGEIYCGGYFNKYNGGSHNYLAKLTNNSDLKENKDDANQLIIFPNPASKRIQIETGQIHEVRKIIIYNTLGVMVKSVDSPASSQRYEIDIDDVYPGVYVVIIVSDQRDFYKILKVIK